MEFSSTIRPVNAPGRGATLLARGAALVVLAALLAGCGGGVKSVRGSVTLRSGASPEGVMVVFHHQSQPLSASGMVGADGAFTLTTHQPGDGAPPGKYKVTAHNPTPADSSQGEGAPIVHPKYARPETSGLEFSVPSAEGYNLMLEGP